MFGYGFDIFARCYILLNYLVQIYICCRKNISHFDAYLTKLQACVLQIFLINYLHCEHTALAFSHSRITSTRTLYLELEVRCLCETHKHTHKTSMVLNVHIKPVYMYKKMLSQYHSNLAAIRRGRNLLFLCLSFHIDVYSF